MVRAINLEEKNVELLIIGGGITGAGIALDAASRGLKVVLVEKGDFGSGTSSASSKLIHGGIRYLKNRDFKLVFEALHERGLLLKLAPGLVKPLPFLIPVYDGGFKDIKKLLLWVLAPEKTTMMELVKAPLALRMALILYDLLAGKMKIEKHRILDKDEVLEAEPLLNPTGLKGGGIYWDAFAVDYRLTLAVVKKARDYGAICLNYTEAVELDRNGEGFTVRIRDKLSKEEFTMNAERVVIAAGPWADAVRERAGMKNRMLRPTKGSHIVLPRERLNIRNALVMEAADGRLTFAIPWDNVVIVGTTEIEYYESPDRVRATKEEVDYLLEVVNNYFPSVNASYHDIITTYSGIRPLIDASGLKATDVTREHRIVEDDGLITIAGGKLTTYRAMAKDVVDRVSSKECITHTIQLKEEYTLPLDVDDDIAEHLRQTYSREEINRILKLVEDEQKLKERILPNRPYIWAEINFAVEKEFTVKLSDIMVRRLGLFFKSPDEEVAERIAIHMGKLLGWSEKCAAREVDEYIKEVETSREWLQD